MYIENLWISTVSFHVLVMKAGPKAGTASKDEKWMKNSFFKH